MARQVGKKMDWICPELVSLNMQDRASGDCAGGSGPSPTGDCAPTGAAAGGGACVSTGNIAFGCNTGNSDIAPPPD